MRPACCSCWRCCRTACPGTSWNRWAIPFETHVRTTRWSCCPFPKRNVGCSHIGGWDRRPVCCKCWCKTCRWGRGVFRGSLWRGFGPLCSGWLSGIRSGSAVLWRCSHCSNRWLDPNKNKYISSTFELFAQFVCKKKECQWLNLHDTAFCQHI